MEKRFFLAIVVSFVILFVWSKFYGLPPSQSVQNIEKKEVTENKSIPEIAGQEKNASDSTVLTPTSPLSDIPENLQTVDMGKIKLTFSDRGGMIKTIFLPDYEETLPVRNIATVSGYENKVFHVVSFDQNRVEYRFENPQVIVSKTYESKEDFLIKVTTEIFEKQQMSKQTTGEFCAFALDMSILKNDPDYERDKALLEYVVYSDKTMLRKNKAFKFSSKDQKEEKGHVFWSGFRSRYFAVIVKPEFGTEGYFVNPVDEKTAVIKFGLQEKMSDSAGTTKLVSLVFAGPEKESLLKKYEKTFNKIKRYYRWDVFDAIAKLIAGVMQLFHRIIPSWGICIILTSLFVYGLTYPMTMRSMLSMKKMQALQPQIAKLREKYSDNPQKLNLETMELYKKNKVNPLGGCLPMLLQMPVFIGLYQVLWRSVEFMGASFLWIRDLSQPDRLASLPFKIPVLNTTDFNILPVVMTLIMFVQQKFSAQNMTTSDPNQAAQQKMMGMIFPVFLGFIFYKFSSGLNLYFTMFYILSIFTQWQISLKTKDKT